MAHIHYLDPKSAVVELLDNYYFQNRLGSLIYQTMARMQGCGYVAADLRGTNSSNSGYIFPLGFSTHLAITALAAWNQTQREPPNACCHYHAKQPVHCPPSSCKGALNVVVRLRNVGRRIR